jgi:site-specific DNA-methyltransferase (adenine-specific)
MAPQQNPALNQLFYGDNLAVLRDHIPSQSVDLIYLDPPFNSRQDYNVLFAEKDGARSASQITAFKDTWEWNEESSLAYEQVVEQGGRVAEAMRAFRTLLGGTDMLAYLAMMAPRLVELRRVLKDTGSIYLHCDPTASHYLKLLLDSIFGPEGFSSEIIWRRTGSHNKAQRWAPIHDTIFFYTKSKDFRWNKPRRPYMLGHVKENFALQSDGTYKTDYYGNVLTGSGTRGGESGLPWKGFDPTAKGRHWAISKQLADFLDEDISKLSQHAKLDRLFEEGYIKIEPGAAWPIPEYTVDATKGPATPDIWAFQPYTEGTVFGTDQGIDADVAWLKPQDQERLGYPTQKPEALLERILRASSNEGDVVLDPFCGCGTTVQVAQKLNRRWIGIDITHLAIGLIKTRLDDAYGPEIRSTYEVIGEPTDVAGAAQLAEENKYQFQYWALGLCCARPTEGIKKGADRGIDGRLYFHDDNSGSSRQIIFSVKGGHNIGVSEVRDLIGVLQRERAEIGVYISFEEPTKPMLREAAEAGFYTSPGSSGAAGEKFPRIQLLSIRDLLEGTRTVQRPLHVRDTTFRKAPRNRPEAATNLPLPLDLR